MALYTVLGASGFVGSALVRHLVKQGHQCQAVGRRDPLPARFGHIIYCIGLTADFRRRPFDTMDAHVSTLMPYLQKEFDSFTYISSTRVYLRVVADVANETAALTVDPNDPEEIYNISKLAGESLCLAVQNPNVRIVRLSNVYGGDDRSENFLTTIIDQILTKGRAAFFISMTSEKDYVSINDVVRALELVPLKGKSRIFNVASGQNVSNREVADLIKAYLGHSVEALPNAPEVRFPRISIDRLRAEIGIQPVAIRDQFGELVDGLRRARSITA